MRAFAYCRVSTQEQARDEHYSLANQEALCRDYVRHKSWRLVKVLRDVGSGKSAEREGYRELLAAIRDGQVDVVATYRLDRLSRNVADVYDALDLFREQGVGFVSVQEAFDTATAMGRAMLGVAAVFALLTREMISESTKDGLLRRVVTWQAGLTDAELAAWCPTEGAESGACWNAYLDGLCLRLEEALLLAAPQEVTALGDRFGEALPQALDRCLIAYAHWLLAGATGAFQAPEEHTICAQRARRLQDR